MDARLTLPILLLLVAVSLTAAVENALRPSSDAFTLTPPLDGSAGYQAVGITGPWGESPALEWSGVPDGTQSLALIAEDLDAPPQSRVFWLVKNIAADQRAIGTGVGSYRAPSWGATATHRLRFTLLALSTAEPQAGASIADLESSALGAATWRTGGGWAF